MQSQEIEYMSSVQTAKSQQLRFEIHRKIAEVPAIWDMLKSEDVFLSMAYLGALEQYPPEGMDFVYILFYDHDRAIGKAYCQIKHFDASKHIVEDTREQDKPCFFHALSKYVKTWVSKRVKSEVLVCGNLLATGEHHFVFDESALKQEIAHQLFDQAIVAVSRQEASIPFVLLKDVLPSVQNGTKHRNHWTQHFIQQQYTEFEIQPNMVLDLVWPSFEEYQAAMSTKYRTRVKRAVKKLGPIEKRRMTLAEMHAHQDEMYRMYMSIATNVGFNMVDLNPAYLAGLQEAMPDRFTTYAYWEEDKLLAYYTLIENGHELEAHFLGYSRELNHDRQIYLNILYDIVAHGISMGKERIVFARTALEIKSSIGAEPEQLLCYLKHSSTITNKLAPRLVEYLKPVEIWQQRHPFKEGSSD